MDKDKKERSKEKEDIYIGTYYVSPENSKIKDCKNYDFFAAVNEEVSHFSKKGLVLLQGDLNCRTGQEKDYVEADKSDDQLGIENFGNQNMRNAEDKTVNTRGKELLEWTYNWGYIWKIYQSQLEWIKCSGLLYST